jgi:hypothetical protein
MIVGITFALTRGRYSPHAGRRVQREVIVVGAARQCAGRTGLRSQAVDCQFEIIPLSPQLRHCHRIRWSAHKWCSMTPRQGGWPGRRRHLIGSMASVVRS